MCFCIPGLIPDQVPLVDGGCHRPWAVKLSLTLSGGFTPAVCCCSLESTRGCWATKSILTWHRPEYYTSTTGELWTFLNGRVECWLAEKVAKQRSGSPKTVAQERLRAFLAEDQQITSPRWLWFLQTLFSGWTVGHWPGCRQIIL